MSHTDVVVVPSTPALLPAYAGLRDPFPDLRSACADAVAWLVSSGPRAVAVISAPVPADNLARGVTEPAGTRIARHLVTDAGFRGELVEADATAPAPPALLVVANGTATRDEKGHGHLDERALAFDDTIDGALRTGTPAALRELDERLGEELCAFDVAAWRRLGALVPEPATVTVDYDDDPYAVRYWVVRWTCGS